MVHVLVPFEDTAMSDRALEHACERYPDATVTVLHVIDFVEAGYAAPPDAGLPGYWEEWYEEEREGAEELFERARGIAAGHGGELETATDLGPPARVIVEFAAEHGVDGIVMGSHGRDGLSRVLLGSVAETVVRRAPCPVTVVR